jgi:uncharacterized protein (DUF433 family)
MAKEYVNYSEGAYRIADTRVSLDSLVYLFREGMSAEGMVESYPALTLEQVHGALAFYLGNQREIDARTGLSCAGCDGQCPRSTFAPPTMPASRAWEIQKSCESQRTPGEFWSARIGARCRHILLTSRLALRVRSHSAARSNSHFDRD